MRFLDSGQKLLWALLGIWLAVNLLQAGLTELDPDEAYYWMYSHALDWGYFDHPPAVALLIRLGTAFAPGTLGIRIGFALLQLGCFYFVWLLAGRPSQKKEVLTFVGLLAAMPLLEVYGFIATPDGPLLFFTALFFWLYQRFLDRKGRWVEALLLGAGMAALLYSKYHGVLLIFFILLSNLKLLRRPGFYLASIFGFLLFLPHLYWQYAHGFPSFLYHLKGRDDAYELKFTITYVLNQMVIFSPLLFPFLVQALRQRPVEGALGRAFYFVIYGFWAFFFYASFKGHVEPQWTAILSIPFVLLLYRQSQISERFGRMVRILSAITIFLILLARLELAFNWAGTKTEFNRRIVAPRDERPGGAAGRRRRGRRAGVFGPCGGEAGPFSEFLPRRLQISILCPPAGLHLYRRRLPPQSIRYMGLGKGPAQSDCPDRRKAILAM